MLWSCKRRHVRVQLHVVLTIGINTGFSTYAVSVHAIRHPLCTPTHAYTAYRPPGGPAAVAAAALACLAPPATPFRPRRTGDRIKSLAGSPSSPVRARCLMSSCFTTCCMTAGVSRQSSSAYTAPCRLSSIFAMARPLKPSVFRATSSSML